MYLNWNLARIGPKDTYTLTLGVPGGKSPAKLTLKFSSAAPSATMKAQGKLDSFGSADEGLVMLTFSFKNMGSGFEYFQDTMKEDSLALYDSKGRELDRGGPLGLDVCWRQLRLPVPR